MTFKEKLKMEHPDDVGPDYAGGCLGCPYGYGYELAGGGLCKGRYTPGYECEACWNREIPGTEGLRLMPRIDEWVDIRWPKENPHLPKHVNCKTLLNSIYGAPKVYIPDIKKVIFNDPATIVIWADGEKTVVKCQNGEPYDPEKGLAMAITKRALGNKGNYFDEIKKWTKEYKKPTKCEPKKPVWEYYFNEQTQDHVFVCPICGAHRYISAMLTPFNLPEKCHNCHVKLSRPNIENAIDKHIETCCKASKRPFGWNEV